jgi:hypothetical protein
MEWRSRVAALAAGAVLAAVVSMLAIGPGGASAATPCHSIEVEGVKARVAVAGVSCEVGREVAAGYYSRVLAEDHPDGRTAEGWIYFEVDGFRCTTGLGGSQAFCSRHDEWVYASSQPEDHPANFDAPAPSSSSCGDVHAHRITGKEVEAGPGFVCSGAQKIMRRYFKLVAMTAQTDGGCAQKRSASGCRVGEYRCHTGYSYATNELHGSCTGPRGTVRFEEIDQAPDA